MGQPLATWFDGIGRDSLEHRRHVRRARRKSSLGAGVPVVASTEGQGPREASPGEVSPGAAGQPDDGLVADLSRVSAEQLLRHLVEEAYEPPRPLTLMRRKSSQLGRRRASPLMGRSAPP